MGQTRVDLLHLLEDLRDAYTGPVEETLLTEIVANSLDSGARRIVLTTDPEQSALLILDDGKGMKRVELARYHDIAASRKARGEGIGFAGVGIKLGLLASEEVVTETRRGSSHVATRWRLASRHRAPWHWAPPPGLLSADGTAVTLRLRNPLSPLLDSGFLEMTLRKHFHPLLEDGFTEVLVRHYPGGVTFIVNGRTMALERRHAAGRSPLTVRLARQRRPSAFGFLWRSRGADPLPEELRGLAVSTFGKVIKRGWDWLGVFPADPERTGGLVEAPLLAGCLTLAKNDFLRSGPRGAAYLAVRKALQEAVSSQLAAWGDATDKAGSRQRRARAQERELATVLEELAAEFPLLASLVQKRPGGQHKLPVGNGSPAGGDFTGTTGPREAVASPESDPPEPRPETPPPPSGTQAEGEPVGTASAVAHVGVPGKRGPRRPMRLGLQVRFESRPESQEPARLAENIVWVNEAHPACRRAAASRSEAYHIAISAAMALATVAVEPAEQRAFVNAFLMRWGGALETSGTGRSHRRRVAPKHSSRSV